MTIIMDYCCTLKFDEISNSANVVANRIEKEETLIPSELQINCKQ
jgi:hypothetical protein